MKRCFTAFILSTVIFDLCASSASITKQLQQNKLDHMLCTACILGNVDDVKHLLRSGADPNTKNELDHKEHPVCIPNALGYALKNGTKEIIMAVLESGAKTSLVNYMGQNVLHQATLLNLHLDIMAIILAYTISLIDNRDNSGKTALLLASWLNNKQFVRLLLNMKANPNIQDKSGTSALHAAATFGNNEIVSQLSAHPDCSINETNNKGETALVLASHNNHALVIRVLLKDHADPNIRDNEGRTPLHRATIQGNIAAVAELVSHEDVHLDAFDNAERTALDYALDQGNVQVVILLRAHNAWEHLPRLRISVNQRLRILVRRENQSAASTDLDPKTSRTYGIEDSIPLLGEHRTKQAEQCAYCFKEGFQKSCCCCPEVFYCNQACQKRDWQKHKNTCGASVPTTSRSVNVETS